MLSTDATIPDSRRAPTATATLAQPAHTTDWTLRVNNGTIKGFLDKVSAASGDTITLYVTTPAPTFDVEVFRLGWYNNGADQAELITSQQGIAGTVQPAALFDEQTGLISAANWSVSTTLEVDNWRTGLYLLRLTAADGDQNFVPLVVRDDVGRHDFLLQHTAATDQAYNNWGGKSTYPTGSSGNLTIGGTPAAVKVSFDRPYSGDGSGPSILGWELNMVRWLEANGFDVGYVSDLDVNDDPEFDARAGAVIQAGHSEYWSKEMRENLAAARARGKGLAFFTGDTARWAVRFEDSQLGKSRVLVCYKNAALDPLNASEPARVTGLWNARPLHKPAHQFLGIGSNGQLERSADWVVSGVDTAPTLFANTGFRNGDVVPNLVGYEYDGLWTEGASPDVPQGLQVLGKAQVAASNPIQPLLNYAAVNQIKAPRPQVGRLSTMLGTTDPGLSWSLYVHFNSGPTNRRFLQYQPGEGTLSRYQTTSGDYAVFRVGKEFSKVGWRRFERDLLADYTAAYGQPPEDARVDHLILSGSISLTPLVFTAADGTISRIPVATEPTAEAGGWHAELGDGEISTGPTGPDRAWALSMKVSVPDGRRPDEAHSVVLQRQGEGLTVAVGTIQWSWALDGYGRHTDPEGNETHVDPRVQALTRNILQALLGRG
jgi:hypothetical protein